MFDPVPSSIPLFWEVQMVPTELGGLFDALFNPEMDEAPYRGALLPITQRGPVRGVALPDGKLVLQQNPNKNSKWGALARKGTRIAWLLPVPPSMARWILLTDEEQPPPEGNVPRQSFGDPESCYQC